MLGLLPSSPDSLDEVRLCELLASREVHCCDLGIDLDARVGREEVVCDPASEKNNQHCKR